MSILQQIIDRCSIWDILIVFSIIGFIVDTIVKSWKGRNNVIQDLLFSIRESLRYFISDEPKGDIVQKLNAGLGFCIIISALAFLGLMIYNYFTIRENPPSLIICFISSFLAFFPAIHFCDKYTRHRYLNKKEIK
ncbi:hypothetical protein [Desulfotignum balticum]|uniref:hypothetical protein n=1 Tax=Desulfotignum balticum TaxID=115781 RepID=UPI0004625618|nr:hypothetical protein [Desulfotignum balticum]